MHLRDSNVRHKHFILLIETLAVVSCGPYRQNIANVPVFRAQGEFQASGNLSFNGWEGQLAYALPHQCALLAQHNNSGLVRQEFSRTNYILHQNYFTELGLGGYRLPSRQDRFALRGYYLLAGMGYSHYFSTGSSSNDVLDVSYHRIGVQCDFVKILRHSVELAISPRLHVVNFYDVNDQTSRHTGIHNVTAMYSELAFTTQYQLLKYLKLKTQFVCMLPLSNLSALFESSPVNASIGLTGVIGQSKSKKPR